MVFDMAVLIHAVEAIASFFLLGLLGYVLTARGWFSNDSARMLSRLVTVIIVPANLVYFINTATTKEQFFPILHYVVVPFASIIFAILIAVGIARLVKVRRSQRNIFITAFACSNTINIGLPINLALFGPEAIPAVLIYYMGNTVIFWTLGNYLLASDMDMDMDPARRTPILSFSTVKRIFSPAILAFLVGLTLLLLNLRLPKIVAEATRQLGGTIAPLSIICIGIAIYQTGLKNIRLSREVALISVGRFIVSPLLIIVLTWYLPVPTMMRNVFIIQSSLPPMSSIALLASHYGTDSGFAAVAISFATLCALVTVPFFMVLVNSF